ncbi:MAG: efflux RND transporter periplasmic adaptor subunit [Lachnospiraceae bacterium]|nr:efflux RND transporter periplasmic adaptor subunit [Lachnospiraceae bacterium]
MKNSVIKRIFALSISAALLTANLTGCAGKTDDTATEVVDTSIDVKTSTPEVKTMSISSNFAATVEADSEVTVMPKVGGEVTSKNFEVGDHVNAGDLLFTIDDESAKISLAQAQAGVSSAEAGVKSAESSQAYAQISAIDTMGTLSTTEQQYANSVDSANASVAAAANSLENAKNSSDLAAKNVDDLDDDIHDAKKDKKKYKRIIDDYYAASSDENREKVLEGTGFTSISDVESAYESAKDDLEKLEDSKDSTSNSKSSAANSVEDAESNYYTAQESAEHAQQQLDDFRNYKKNTTIASTANSLQSAESSVASSKASLDQANASLDNAKLALEYTQVTAPVSGTITAINVSLHNTTSTGASAYVIQSDAKNKIVFYVTEDTANNMKVGNSAIVTKGDEKYDAKITQINTSIDSSKGLFKVEASLVGSDNLTTGTDVMISTVTRESDNVLTVPVTAVYYEGEQAFVYKNNNGVAEKTNVSTGITDDYNVEVTDGLKNTDEIIVSYSSQLTDGSEIKASSSTAVSKGSTEEAAE